MLFRKLAECFEAVEKASSRLEMTRLLAGLFKDAQAKEIGKIVYLFQGQLGPSYAAAEIGMGEKFVEDAIARTSGYSRAEVEVIYKEKGDLGLVAEAVAAKKRQRALYREELTVAKVFENLERIASSTGAGSQAVKIKLLSELLNSATPKEARYITRIPLGNLRLGTGDPTIMDALASLYVDEAMKNMKIVNAAGKKVKAKKDEKREEELGRRIKALLRERIEDKYNIHSDLGSIAQKLKERGLKGLDGIEIKVGTPIRPTLAERLPSAEDIVKKLGKCAIESKYDGIRLQLHKAGDKVTIFSRRSEDMTDMFPEIVDAARKQIKADEAIFEGEALAYNEQSEEFYPFQVTMQRKRKYGIKEMAKEMPLKLFVFDTMYINGKNIMDLPFRERRKALGKIVGKGDTIVLTDSIITDNAKEMEKFFEESVSKGLEGIIAKDLDAPYIAGARKFAWIKLKRSYKGELEDTVDVVILGYYKGRGMRAKFGIGALLSGAYDKNADKFVTLAKVGSGFSEKRMVELEGMLSKIKVKKKPARVYSVLEPDFWVEPKYVIEVNADEITKSPIHTCARGKGKEGYALRFPRMVKMRPERKPEEATTESEIVRMYKQQRHVSTEEASAGKARA